jgi:hypothetical protein
MLCTSFEPIDPGNDEVVEVEVPYVREALGSEIKEEAVISN